MKLFSDCYQSCRARSVAAELPKRSIDADVGTRPGMRHRVLTVAVSGALALGLQASVPAKAHAQVFPASIELSSLDGSNGIVLNGEAVGALSGQSVSGAGDFNGDGVNDLIIGAPYASPNGANSGRSYLVFGAETGLSNPFQLASLNGVNGFAINGEAENHASGVSVSAAGDINGDGIDDLIIGAVGADPNGSLSGRSYVVFGVSSGLLNPIELSSLDGLNGFVLNGEAEDDRSGSPVSAAGDINGDGIDDLLVGAFRASPNGSRSGRSYVVFGASSGLPAALDLSSLDGNNGFVLNGEAADDFSSLSASVAGDINGDGIDDLIIGAPGADSNGITDSGRSYVVYGSDTGLLSPFQLSSLDGSNGFVLNGEAADDYSGASVSAAGDINGDGIDDLIVGAWGASPNGSRSGRSYVVFGASPGLPNPFELSSLDGNNGFVLNGEAEGDEFGRSVSGAGDINGDGIDDLIVAASLADPNGAIDSGRSYVVFGASTGLPDLLEVSDLDGSNGFVLNGEAADDASGGSISAAGDINGDGIDDLMIGAAGADPNGDLTGRTYVVFGRAAFDVAVNKSNGAGFVEPGQPVTYFIDVSNLGTIAVDGASLVDTLPVTLDASTASWTCSGIGGAVCPNASGSGNLNEIIDLPSGGMLSYELTAVVLAAAGEIVSNTASVALPSGLVDINSSNNSATDSDPAALSVIFADGFEND